MEYNEALRKGYVPGTGGAGGVYEQVLQAYAGQNKRQETTRAQKDPQYRFKQQRAADDARRSQSASRGPRLSMSPWGGVPIRQIPTAPNPANDVIAQMGSGPGSDPYGTKGGYKGFAIPQFSGGALGQQERQAFTQYFVDLLASRGHRPIGAGGRPNKDLEVLSEIAGYKMQPSDYMPSWDKNILAEKQAAAQAQIERRTAIDKQNLAQRQQRREMFGLPSSSVSPVGTYAVAPPTTDAVKEIGRLSTRPEPTNTQERQLENTRLQRDNKLFTQQILRKQDMQRRNYSLAKKQNTGEPWKGFNNAMKAMKGQR